MNEITQQLSTSSSFYVIEDDGEVTFHGEFSDEEKQHIREREARKKPMTRGDAEAIHGSGSV